MPTLLDDPRLDWDLLEAFSFSSERFLEDAAAIKRGTVTDASALLRGKIEPFLDVTEVRWGPDAEEVRRVGVAALEAGKVALVILNGGMATRFGNVVKGIVEVFDGESFLSLKAHDVRQASERFNARIPLVLMNSFATDAATMELIEDQHRFGLGDALMSFEQTIAIRLDPDGELFVDAHNKPSYYAPGHGEFFACLRRSGVLKELRESGVETILFSNVDNLGATIDPVILGHHLRTKKSMSAEVTAKRRTASGAWDKGGAPARVDGRVVLVEGFRFPPDLEEGLLPDFSTNNFLFQADAIDQPIPLERFLVKKSVDGRPAIQFETITCEATSAMKPEGTPLLSLGILRVPRDGEHGRLFPIKERADLDAMREPLKKRLGRT
jgi:UTP--glucose-1-phosphate uridylyltransferase